MLIFKMAFVTAVRSYSVNTTENKFVVLVIVVVWTANIWKISYKKKTILSLEIVFVETFPMFAFQKCAFECILIYFVWLHAECNDSEIKSIQKVLWSVYKQNLLYLNMKDLIAFWEKRESVFSNYWNVYFIR